MGIKDKALAKLSNAEKKALGLPYEKTRKEKIYDLSVRIYDLLSEASGGSCGDGLCDSQDRRAAGRLAEELKQDFYKLAGHKYKGIEWL